MLTKLRDAFRIRTIHARLLIAFVAMVLLMATAIIATTAWRGLREGRQQALNQLELAATFKEAEINVLMDRMHSRLKAALEETDVLINARAALETLKSSPQADVTDRSAHVSSRFFYYVRRTQWFEEIFLLDVHGRGVASTGITHIDEVHTDQPYFREGLRGRHASFYFASPDQLRILVAQPVLDQQGETIGVLAGYTDLDELNEILMEQVGLGKTGWAYLVGSDHAVLSEARSHEAGPMSVDTAGLNEALETQGKYAGLVEDYRGVPVVGVYRWLPQLQVVLGAEQYQSEALKTVYATLALNVGLALAAAAIAVFASLLITRNIADPLADLTRTATGIAAGDLERVAEVRHEDEIGALARAFNSMTAQLRQTIGDLERHVAELKQTQEALRESEQRLKEAQAMGKIGSWEFDIDGQTITWSDQVFKLYERDPALGPPTPEEESTYYTPEQAKMLREYAQRAVETGEEFEYGLQAKLPSGRIAHFSASMRPIRDRRGRVVRLFGTVQDITERKRAEEALKESENRFRSITENAVDFIFIKDRARRYTFVNQAMQGLLGLPEGDVLGKTPEEVFGLEQGRIIREVDDRAFSGETVNETRSLMINNRQLFLNTIQTPLSIEDGEVTSIMGIVRDVTERVQAEEALRESEGRNRAILNALPDLMFVQGRDGTYLDYHATDIDALYVPPEQFLGKKMQDVFPEAFAAAILDLIEQAVVTGKMQVYDYELPVAGQSRHFEARIVPHGEDKTLSIIREITGQVQAERTTRERQRYLESVLSAAPDAIVTLDPQNRIVDWNSGAERLFGYRRQEVIGQDVDPLIAQGDIMEEAVTFTRLVSGGGTLLPTETVRYRRDGLPVNVIVAGAPIVVDDELVGVVAVYTDITARKQAEQERERLATQVREQARELQQILTTVPEGVLLLDAEGRALQANPVAENALAVLAGARVGDVVTRLGDRPLAELLTSPPTRGLWHEVKADKRTFEVIARPMDNGAEAEHWVLVVNDVTREREVQAQLQQQERLAAVGQLAAGIAHDFNNIMASIVLYAQMTARSRELSERNRERMAVINQQARHATRLIEQILDFSRRAVLERRPLDLLPLLKEQVELLKRTLPEHIRIELSYGRDECTIHADPTRIQQMITNLAVNARDAMPEGGTLRIGLKRITVEQGESPPLPGMEAGEWIRLTVSDTGTGIAPDVLPHIFEPFFTVKGPGEGSGLGLAQVHGIVGQHRGFIDVETRMGEETTFTIYLPALEVHLTEPPLPDVSAVPQGQGEVVLVVEDGEAVRAALVASLEQLNYQTLEAANGEQALAVMAEQGEQIALVLSDVVMPGMGGMALFHALRQKGWEIPVILLTGHPMDRKLEELREQGLAAWLTKPPSLERLAHAIDDALPRR